MRLCSKCIISVVVFLLWFTTEQLYAQTTYDWTGTTSTSWTTSTNWFPNGVPGVNDTVTITNHTNNPVCAGTATVKSLTISSGVLTINAGDTLKVTTAYVLSATGSPLQGGGVLNIGTSTTSATFVTLGPVSAVANIDVTVNVYASTSLIFRNSKYKRPFSLSFTGTATSSGGGNRFDSLLVVRNYSSGILDFGTDSDSIMYHSEFYCNGTGNLSVGASSGNTIFQGNATFTTTSTGDILIANTGSCYFYKNINYINTGSSFTAEIGGNIGSLYLKGNYRQQINCTNCSYTAYKLILDKSSDSTVTLNADMTIVAISGNPGTIDFIKGKLIIPSSYSLVFNATTGWTNATDLSYVNGTVTKIGNTNFTFPVGGNTIYRPLQMYSLTGFASNTSVSVLYFDTTTTVTSIGSGSAKYVLSPCEYWSIVSNSTGAKSAKLNFPWPKAPCYNSNPVLMQSTASQWNAISTTLVFPDTVKTSSTISLPHNTINLFTYGFAEFFLNTKDTYLNKYEVWQATTLLEDSLLSSISGTGNGIVKINPTVPGSGTSTLYLKIKPSNHSDSLTVSFDINSTLSISNVKAEMKDHTYQPMSEEFYRITSNAFGRGIIFTSGIEEAPVTITTNLSQGTLASSTFKITGLSGLTAEVNVYALGGSIPLATLTNPGKADLIQWTSVSAGHYKFILKVTDSTTPSPKVRYYEGQFVKP